MASILMLKQTDAEALVRVAKAESDHRYHREQTQRIVLWFSDLLCPRFECAFNRFESGSSGGQVTEKHHQAYP